MAVLLSETNFYVSDSFRRTLTKYMCIICVVKNSHDSIMTLAITDFNLVLTVLGAWILVSGLFSHLLKERFYLSDSLLSFLAGTACTRIFPLLNPASIAGGSQAVDTATLNLSRLVLGVQLVLAGVHLPSRYLLQEWRSLSLLLGPGMIAMWISSSLALLFVLPSTPILSALAIAACVTPTDPVLSSAIVQGHFADENLPLPLRDIVVAESGANDGLGYPFLFSALYLIQYWSSDEKEWTTPVTSFIGTTCVYVVLFSIIYGLAIGYMAKALLRQASTHKFVTRESFLVAAVAMALFVIGTGGAMGTDDVLACFVAGNAFTWDDWFRLETLGDSVQPVVDMLLNVAMFLWLGAVCPWESFVEGPVALWRLVVLGVLVLGARRIPVVYFLLGKVRQIEDLRQALFVGYFGPIGVSAIFYLYIGLEFLESLAADGDNGDDGLRSLADTMRVVVWFLVIFSVVVHGLSVPVGKLVYSIKNRSAGGSIALP
ncbi:na h antiporter [Echria macrotheca]|uniref:Na h antiporter n=1 Tax=Echria macrotheca TaxID=438768 RepID=A0AAJ0B0E9_9PEZI|nr:na h antiporter [Echria macrotheca]